MKSTYHTEVDVESRYKLLADRFLTLKLFIKLDIEGHEYEALRGVARLLARSTSLVWLVEIGFKENFNDLVNPDFSKIFDLFWSHGYVAKTAHFRERLIEPADI